MESELEVLIACYLPENIQIAAVPHFLVSVARL